MFLAHPISDRLNVDDIVTPGEEITADVQFMRGHGTFSKDGGSTMYASVVGSINRVNKLISVIPVRYNYIPEIGDVIVGRVLEVSSKRWKVDVHGRLDATLHLASVNLPGGVQRRKLESDELQMQSYFSEGDALVAEVQQINNDGNILLHTRSLKYGKLRNGIMLSVPPNSIERMKSHFLELPYGVDVVLGLNGMIWISMHVPEFTMEQIEQNPRLLYTNDCVHIPKERRNIMARVYNCIKILVEANILLSETSIIKAYENSLNFDAKSLLNEKTRDMVIKNIKISWDNQMQT